MTDKLSLKQKKLVKKVLRAMKKNPIKVMMQVVEAMGQDVCSCGWYVKEKGNHKRGCKLFVN